MYIERNWGRGKPKKRWLESVQNDMNVNWCKWRRCGRLGLIEIEKLDDCTQIVGRKY